MTAPAVDAYHPATLVARSDAGGGLSLLTLELRPDVASTYAAPGQYVEVRAGGETGYFVLANEPGAPAWELIMRAGGGASDLLLAMAPGTPVEVTRAIGDGFPMGPARGNPLLIALSGTGVAAARPLVRRRIADGDAALTRLLVGIRTRVELPLERDLGGWAAAGVGVLVCLSQYDAAADADGAADAAADADAVATAGAAAGPDGKGRSDDGRFARGYVQDVLRVRPESRPPAGARIFAVGVASMVDALRELAPAMGIAPEHVHTNH
jgi:NAD(P)H-flavin reductase